MTGSLQDIRRTFGLRTTEEILFVADGVNHVQWFYASQVKDLDEMANRGCEDCSDIHYWRRVYVKV